MEKKMELDVKFEELQDYFKNQKRENKAVELKEDQFEVNKFLSDFIGKDFDLNVISSMMNSKDTLRSYNQFIELGTKINLLNQATITYVKVNWTWFLEHVTDVETLAKFCYGKIEEPWEITELIEKKGVDANLAFSIAKETILSEEGHCYDVYAHTMHILCENGFTGFESWLDSLPKDSELYDIFIRHILNTEWEKYVNQARYYDAWLERNLNDVLSSGLCSIPDKLPLEVVLERTTGKQWIEGYHGNIASAVFDFEAAATLRQESREPLRRFLKMLIDDMDIDNMRENDKKKYFIMFMARGLRNEDLIKLSSS